MHSTTAQRKLQWLSGAEATLGATGISDSNSPAKPFTTQAGLLHISHTHTANKRIANDNSLAPHGSLYISRRWTFSGSM